MKKYTELIESTKLINNIDLCLTSGDLEYPGTAMEIVEQNGEELFHIILDSKGERQVLFFAQQNDYRISLEKLESIFAAAKNKVCKSE
ncbi:MAG: hypothetical protein GY928_21170 [Colwellia sp.]|nr:hypothetical protein [Colwellia sp.]